MLDPRSLLYRTVSCSPRCRPSYDLAMTRQGVRCSEWLGGRQAGGHCGAGPRQLFFVDSAVLQGRARDLGLKYRATRGGLGSILCCWPLAWGGDFLVLPGLQGPNKRLVIYYLKKIRLHLRDTVLRRWLLSLGNKCVMV